MAAVPSALQLFDICAGKSFVVQVAKVQAPVNGPLNLILRKTSVKQLAGQFEAAVVSSRQKPQSSGETVHGISLILHEAEWNHGRSGL